MSILIQVVLCLTSLTLIACTPPPQALTLVPGCYHNGQMYAEGQSFGHVCSPCRCMHGGQVSCIAIDCAFGMCVDAVRNQTRCCPHCPNGPNCKTQNGTIIKQGEVYKPDTMTTCSCPTLHMGFGSGGRQAQCITLF